MPALGLQQFQARLARALPDPGSDHDHRRVCQVGIIPGSDAHWPHKRQAMVEIHHLTFRPGSVGIDQHQLIGCPRCISA